MSQTLRKFIKFTDMPFGRIERYPNTKAKAEAAEPTGNGDLLVIEGYFGKMFRSSEEAVRDAIAEYIRRYKAMCTRLDEDPASLYFDVMSYNDLYALLNVTPCVAGDCYGYTNTEDYRVDLGFDIQMVDEGGWTEEFGEKYLYFEPEEWCRPDPCYMEV